MIAYARPFLHHVPSQIETAPRAKTMEHMLSLTRAERTRHNKFF
jgi:hypothetical protein